MYVKNIFKPEDVQYGHEKCCAKSNSDTRDRNVNCIIGGFVQIQFAQNG